MAAKASFFMILRLKAVSIIPPAPSSSSASNSSSLKNYHYLLTTARSSYYDKCLSGIIWVKSFSSSSSNSLDHHPKPKDPNLVDDDVRAEGVFRFDTSETESMGISSSSCNDNRAMDDQAHQFPNDHGGGVAGTGRIGSSNSNHDADDSNYYNDGGDSNAKEGTVQKAMETGHKAGEMAKQTMDIVWDTAMGTANSIKESVAGDDGMEKKK